MTDMNGNMSGNSPGTGPAAPPPQGNDLLRNPLVLGGVAVVVIGAIVGAYFLGSHRGTTAPAATATTAAGGTEVSQADLSARNVCQATLDRVRGYGIVEPAAALVSNDAENTSTKNRLVCSAKAGDVTYRITVDQLCDNMGEAKCIALQNVTDSTGKVLFQKRDFLPPEE